jgi:predicted enzyme related to lactoylglutathione lyase
MSHPVVHWEIVGKNGAKLQEYYANLFGWEINTNTPMNYGLVDTKGPGINGGIGQTDGPNYVTIYVEVQDLQAMLDKAEALGGKTLVPPTDIPNTVSFAMFADPEGNVVGLVKSRE